MELSQEIYDFYVLCFHADAGRKMDVGSHLTKDQGVSKP